MNFVQLSVEMVSKITLCSQSKVTVKVILLMFCSCLDDHPPNSIVFMLRFEIRVQGALSCLALVHHFFHIYLSTLFLLNLKVHIEVCLP